MLTQHRSNRTPSGSKMHKGRDKRLFESGREATHSRIGETQKKVIRMKGGAPKTILFKTDIANVLDTKSKIYLES